MFVFYPNEDKVGVKTIKTFAERMKTEGVSRALMVVQANLTPFAKQCLGEMISKYHIEVVSTPHRAPLLLTCVYTTHNLCMHSLVGREACVLEQSIQLSTSRSSFLSIQHFPCICSSRSWSL